MDTSQLFNLSDLCMCRNCTHDLSDDHSISSVAFIPDYGHECFINFSRQRSVHSQPGKAYISNVQMQLLKQSGLVFTLYAVNTLTFNRIRGTLIYASQTSIFCVLAMTAVAPGKIFDHFLIAYIENLLNLSIAAIYPICFLAMSGEMKR